MDNQTDQKNAVVLLGIESSGATCGVGISRDNRMQGEITVNSPNIHSEKLAVFVEFILDNLQIPREDLSAIVLSAGPGSFTGLRIGYSLAKGIAHPLNMPIIEVSTLDVWAYQEGEQPGQTIAVIDAYRGELFYSIYEWQNDQMKRVSDYSIIRIENMNRVMSPGMCITGAISEKIKAQIRESQPGAVFSRRTSLSPSPAALLELGYRKFNRKEFSGLNDSEPFYMRKFKGVS